MIKNKDELRQTKNYKKITEKNGFLKVPKTFAVRFDLTPAELLIYCAIAEETKNGDLGAFCGSLTTLCSMFNISNKTAQRALIKLEYRGLIRRADVKYNERKTPAYIQCKVTQLKIDDI